MQNEHNNNERPISMKALLLVGGLGSRLQLSNTISKPFLPFCNKPMLEYIIYQFCAIGITDFIFAISRKSYEVEYVQKVISRLKKEHGITITCSIEDELLGTGGAVLAAKSNLMDCSSFFVINSDIMSILPLKAMLKFHQSTLSLGTILGTEVEDPSRFGVLDYDPITNKIKNFVEKPDDTFNLPSHHINAGMYILNTEALKYFAEGKPLSIEREVFPVLVNAPEGMYMFSNTGYWSDIGTLTDYIDSQSVFLKNFKSFMLQSQKKENTYYSTDYRGGARHYENVNIIGPVLISNSASIGPLCSIGPNVVIGPNSIIESNQILTNCTLLLDGRIHCEGVCKKCIVSGTEIINVCDTASDVQ